MFSQPFDVEKMILDARLKDLDRELKNNMYINAVDHYHKKQSPLSKVRVSIGRMMVRIGERLADTSIDASNCAEEVSW